MIINFKKNEIINNRKMQKFAIFDMKSFKINSIVKLEMIVIIQVNTEVLHIVYVI